MTDDELQPIGRMCEMFDVTPRTLRFYEAKDLLSPVRYGQKRLFTRRDRARLKLILRGKRFGFSLEEIRQLLNLYDIGDQQVTQISRTYETAVRHREEMIARRDELIAAIEDLDVHLKWAEDVLASKGITNAAQKAPEEPCPPMTRP